MTYIVTPEKPDLNPRLVQRVREQLFDQGYAIVDDSGLANYTPLFQLMLPEAIGKRRRDLFILRKVFRFAGEHPEMHHKVRTDGGHLFQARPRVDWRVNLGSGVQYTEPVPEEFMETRSILENSLLAIARRYNHHHHVMEAALETRLPSRGYLVMQVWLYLPIQTDRQGEVHADPFVWDLHLPTTAPGLQFENEDGALHYVEQNYKQAAYVLGKDIVKHVSDIALRKHCSGPAPPGFQEKFRTGAAIALGTHDD